MSFNASHCRFENCSCKLCTFLMSKGEIFFIRETKKYPKQNIMFHKKHHSTTCSNITNDSTTKFNVPSTLNEKWGCVVTPNVPKLSFILPYDPCCVTLAAVSSSLIDTILDHRRRSIDVRSRINSSLKAKALFSTKE